MFRNISIVTHEPDLLGLVRELYSRRPENRDREAWELQHVLYSLNYINGLVEEADIAAAIEVARTDWTPNECTA